MLVKVIGRLYPIQCCTLGARDIIQLQQLICEQYALSFVFICVFCEQYSLSFMLICVFCKQYSLRQLLFSHGTICLGLLVNCSCVLCPSTFEQSLIIMHKRHCQQIIALIFKFWRRKMRTYANLWFFIYYFRSHMTP